MSTAVPPRPAEALDDRAEPADRARALAERLHRRQVEPSGRPVLEHVRRVAAAVPAFARPVAWLHDAVERTPVTERELRRAGLGPDEMEALRLLTRDLAAAGDDAFIEHVGIIGLAGAAAGEIARAVKAADMDDRARRPRDPTADWIPPYARARALLQALRPRPR